MADITGFLPPGLEGLAPRPESTGAEKDKNLGQEEFFQLMVAQLRNQDPLKPLESNEFLAQVAQFSTVDGITRMEASISQLATSLQSHQALQASTLVGRNVLVPGDTAELVTGETLTGALELDASAAEVVVRVLDPAGQEVRRLQLGTQPAGSVRFAWDGYDNGGEAVSPGMYTVKAEALVDGENRSLSTLVASTIDSVTLSQQPPGMVLNVRGIGQVDVNDIRELM